MFRLITHYLMLGNNNFTPRSSHGIYATIALETGNLFLENKTSYGATEISLRSEEMIYQRIALLL